MGLLDGEIKKAIGGGFKGLLLKGTLRRETAAGVDNMGDPTGITVETYSIEGIRDSITYRYAANYGVPVTDSRILVIADLINPPTDVRKKDKIDINGKWYEVRAVLEIDPAGATYTVSGFECAAP